MSAWCVRSLEAFWLLRLPQSGERSLPAQVAAKRSVGSRSAVRRLVGVMVALGEAQFAAVFTGIQNMLIEQQAAMTALAAQAVAVKDRFTQSDSNLQTVMSSLEGRLTDKQKLANALAAVSTNMAGLSTGFEQMLGATEARGPSPRPNSGVPQAGQAGPGVAAGGAVGTQKPAATFDPWVWTSGSAASAPPTATPWQGGSGYAPTEAAATRTKDLVHILPFRRRVDEIPRLVGPHCGQALQSAPWWHEGAARFGGAASPGKHADSSQVVVFR